MAKVEGRLNNGPYPPSRQHVHCFAPRSHPNLRPGRRQSARRRRHRRHRRRRRRRHRPMATLTSLLTSSPLHVLLVEVLTRYLKNYGVRPRLTPLPPVCVRGLTCSCLRQ